MTVWRSGVALLALLTALCPRPGHAGSLADVFRSPTFARLGLAPLGGALAATVAATYPVASASSSVVYEYNPALETMERRTGIAGPLFGERAETIGRGLFDVSLTYSYIHFATIDGDDLDSLPSRRSAGGRMLTIRVPGGRMLRDGRFTTFLPVQVTADIDVTAHQLAASATYGVTPRLDVNLTVPLLRTSLDLTASGVAPDPRFPAFALPGGRTLGLEPSASAAATGVGDVLLRAKYLLHQGAPVDVAVALALALPTGDEDDFQGAGSTRVQPALILSRVFAGRFEPFVNLGIECNAAEVDRSVVRWAVGGVAEVGAGLTAVVTFLGHNELGAQADPIPAPFFFQIERNDIYDASVGLRWRFAEQGIVSANVIVPLNRQGLRAVAVPALNVEYFF
jgi:Putative MetA-pathway of phenol degradation